MANTFLIRKIPGLMRKNNIKLNETFWLWLIFRVDTSEASWIQLNKYLLHVFFQSQDSYVSDLTSLVVQSGANLQSKYFPSYYIYILEEEPVCISHRTHKCGKCVRPNYSPSSYE